MDLRSGKKANNAVFVSWDLDSTGGVAGGLRRLKTSNDKDRRFVFVRTSLDIQRIDVANCTTTKSPTIIGTKQIVTCVGARIKWSNQVAAGDQGTDMIDPGGDSDVAIDDLNKVYVAVATVTPDGSSNPEGSFIQRLDATITDPNTTTPNAVRWKVGGSAGLCADAVDSSPCISGIAIRQRDRQFVYYSEPMGGPDGQGAIGELDTVNNKVRRWTFAELNRQLALQQKQKDPTVAPDVVREPRHLQFDDDGTLWVVTGDQVAHHLVSLDIKKNRMTKHRLPDSVAPDLFQVSPDSNIIGYSNTGPALFTATPTEVAPNPSNIVGILMPARNFVVVQPVQCQQIDPSKDQDPSALCPVRENVLLPPLKQDAIRITDSVRAVENTITTRRTANADGVFNEALTDSRFHDSFSPLGVFADKSGPVGTVFYAVGENSNVTVNRLERARLRQTGFQARVERDDDDFDDDGKRADVDDDWDDDGVANAADTDNDNDGTANMNDDDDDNDGIEDSFDTKDKKETRQNSQQDVIAGDAAADVFTVNPGTLLVVASAVSSNLLAPVACEILDSTGTIVASSLVAAGTSVVTWVPPAGGGTYTLRVKNQSLGLSTITTKILMRELWAVPVVGGLL
jgi:hypothetical protein